MSRRSPRLRVVLGLVVVSAAVAWGIVAPAAAQPDNPTRIDLAAGAPLRDAEAQLLAGETVQFRQQHGPQAVATAVGAYFTSGDPRLAVIAVALDWREAGRLAAERIDGSDSPGDRAALLLLRIALGRPLQVEASGQVRVAAGPAMLPAASNGHGRIAYWQQVGDRRELRLAGPGLAAPRLVLISDEPRSATFPGRAMEWSPSGETLAFRGIRGGRSRLYVVSASGADLRCLTPPGQSEYGSVLVAGRPVAGGGGRQRGDGAGVARPARRQRAVAAHPRSARFGVSGRNAAAGVGYRHRPAPLRLLFCRAAGAEPVSRVSVGVEGPGARRGSSTGAIATTESVPSSSSNLRRERPPADRQG